MRRTRKDKSSAERYHFQTRCLQRLGFLVDYDEIIKLIQKNKLTLHSRQSNRVTRWIWEHQGKKYIVVYDKERKQLVTILFFEDVNKCNNTEQ